MNFKIVILSMLWLITPIAKAESYPIDLDCDGILDHATIEIFDQGITVKVWVSSISKNFDLEFGLNRKDQQDSICGNTPKLSKTKFEHSCNSLVLQDTEYECDAIYINYNKTKEALSWSRS